VNGYERFQSTLRGEPCDFLPRMPILMAFKARFAGVDYESLATDCTIKAEANIRCAEHFRFDVVDVMSDPYCETQGFGGEIEYPHDEVPRCPNPPLAATKDLACLLKPRPLQSERMANTVNTVCAYREKVHRQYSIHGWVEGPAAEAADLRGVMAFLMDVLLDPQWCAELMDVCTEVAIEFARTQIESGADVIGVGDSICSQLPPDVYAELVAPRQEQLFQSIRAAGGRVRLHICGDITHLMPIIKDLSIDILDVDHLVDIFTARSAVGAKMVLAGNLDPVKELLQGNPDAVRKKIRNIYDRIGNPMIVTAGCEIPRDTPHENVFALCDQVTYVANLGRNIWRDECAL
jgi:MtaA/CmuA family methyltransferase